MCKRCAEEIPEEGDSGDHLELYFLARSVPHKRIEKISPNKEVNSREAFLKSDPKLKLVFIYTERGGTRMDILQARDEARKSWNPRYRIIFNMVDQQERPVKCEWVDPDKGMFTMEKMPKGFYHVDDFIQNGVLITDVKILRK